MFPSSIAKDQLQQLPLLRFDGTIHVVDTPEALEEVVPLLRREPVLGFDTETKPSFNKGEHHDTAIIQLATATDAYLIRIKLLGIAPALRKLFEQPQVLKVGISIRDDLKNLRSLHPFRPAGFVDLNAIAKELGVSQIGVRNLAGIFLEGRISKSQQTSNWESKELTAGQQLYAATDAWICLRIYQSLTDRGYIS